MANMGSNPKNGGGGRGLFPGLNGIMTPEEAEAAIAYAEANPIAPKPFMDGWQSPILNKPGFHIEGVRIEDQKEKPEAPEVRIYATSAYNKVIPISLGQRRLVGNIIQCSAIIPRLVGTREYFIDYEVPIFEDPVEPPGTGAESIDTPLCR